VTADLSISEVARAAEFFCSNGIIVTGSETGQPVDSRDLSAVREATPLPVILGSGVTEDNLGEYHGKADALIVGSHFKVGGHWHSDVDKERVQRFMARHKQYETAV
jgi:predicted TIM-barrel enzyme